MFGRLFAKRDLLDEYEKQRLNAKKQEEQAQPMNSRSRWFEQMLTTENSVDEYEKQRLNEKKEEEQIRPLYSVMIHFTPQAPYVYILENDTFVIYDGVAIVGDFLEPEMRVGGSFVYQNELGDLQEVELFLKDYQLQNPIRIEYLEE
ncbi:hypothetical protein [Paenibacillus polymyxa]|uniref:Uncharacterized protein n=1 Tax=Paenibacillus polymyxa (strain SC2) TaxID=886882 RepID=E3EK89_PAEPS|nr:hypothetical protein [Paenibacillus polymyxa]ADO59416.1 hypothetical protein PPSC2_27970 [Paenibacillus polymyxa SC2]WPQ59743.1 hypothetical protein SKN87_25990 [Paenibacillus polymyxa]